MTNEETNPIVELERTEIINGYDNIFNLAINDFSKIEKRLDICTFASGLGFFNNPLVLNELTILNKKGVKLRFITEITKDNLEYAKQLANLMDFHHLDGIKVNFEISDGKRYACTSKITEEQTPNELLYSTVKTFVKQQQFLYDILWGKSIPAEQKIKDIEGGKSSNVWTKVLDDPEDIIRELTF